MTFDFSRQARRGVRRQPRHWPFHRAGVRGGGRGGVDLRARRRDAGGDARRDRCVRRIRRMPASAIWPSGEAIRGYIAEAAKALGGIDMLVNNASGFGIGR